MSILLEIFSAGLVSASNTAMITLKDLTINDSCNFLSRFQAFTQVPRFSVKVLSDAWGSGVIFSKRRSAQEGFYYYQVLTNHHVIKDKKVKYRIKTHSGKIYPVKRIEDLYSTTNEDLAILTFEANDCDDSCDVAVFAKINNAYYFKTVFAAGYPIYPKQADRVGLEINQGSLTTLLSIPLRDGYQIGYESEVKEGMSGGAIVDCKGNVVGVNGMAKRRAFKNNSYFFKDGREVKPSSQEYKVMSQLSWGIPIPKNLINLQKKSSFIPLPQKPQIIINDNEFQAFQK